MKRLDETNLMSLVHTVAGVAETLAARARRIASRRAYARAVPLLDARLTPMLARIEARNNLDQAGAVVRALTQGTTR